MKTPRITECYAIILAAVTFLVVMVACYISVQLYQVKRTNRGQPPPSTSGNSRERFLAPMFYNPVCRADFLRDTRSQCKGYTTGISPSIEANSMEGGWMCPGLLGTQP
jgi:hypothetical protein